MCNREEARFASASKRLAGGNGMSHRVAMGLGACEAQPPLLD
jgi:hypothetical protein